jgi:hypothetical protein
MSHFVHLIHQTLAGEEGDLQGTNCKGAVTTYHVLGSTDTENFGQKGHCLRTLCLELEAKMHHRKYPLNM